MAKSKNTKSSKSGDNRPNVDKIVKKVNKEFEKTSTQIEKLVDDAFKQLDSLQNQIQEPVRKLMKEIDELREREMKRFHDELDRRMEEFQKIQNTVMDRLGIAQREAKRGQESVTRSLEKEATSTAKTAKKAGKKTAAKARASASINQIANPTEAEQEKLSQFSSMKGFRSWPDEAKKLIG